MLDISRKQSHDTSGMMPGGGPLRAGSALEDGHAGPEQVGGYHGAGVDHLPLHPVVVEDALDTNITLGK